MRALARAHSERVFIFHHQFTLEAAYGSLLRRRRRILHKRVAEALETLYPDHIEENLGLLAHHWEQAEDTEQALVYLHRAGKQTAARYANAEARAYFSRALDLLPPDRLEERLTILLAREDIHHLQGMRDAQQRDLQALQDVVAALENQSTQVIVALRRARHAKQTGAWVLCTSLLQETLPLIEGIQDVQDKAQSYLEWGKLQLYDFEARASLEKAIQLAHTSGLKAIEAESWRELGLTEKKPEQAALYYERGLQLSREIENRRLEGMTCNVLAAVLSDIGNETEAQRYLELGIRLCREVGNHFDEGWGVLQLAGLCYHQGGYAAALHHAQEAQSLAGEIQSPAMEFCALECITQVFRDLGQHTEAITHCEHVLHDARETGNPVMVCWALLYTGLSAHYLGDDVRALALGQEVLRTGQALGEERVQKWAWALVGHALTGLGRLDAAGAAYHRSLSQAELPSGWTLCRWAGLIRIALLKGGAEVLQEALPQVEGILRYWDAHPALRNVDFERFESCWTCYRLLQTLQDPRAPEVLERTYTLVQATAAKLQDPEHRRMFLENVTAHRDIISEWERVHTGAS
jgi:tetratricopeptide (TPR) repeat protein